MNARRVSNSKNTAVRTVAKSMSASSGTVLWTDAVSKRRETFRNAQQIMIDFDGVVLVGFWVMLQDNCN